MKLESGMEVIDSSGKNVGTVDRIIRDSWSGDIKKFMVNTGNVLDQITYSPEDVEESTESQVKLKTAFNKPADVTIQAGAKVIDKNGKTLGTVDYIINDTYTGEASRFRVNTGKSEELFISTEDVLSVTVTEIKLKVASS